MGFNLLMNPKYSFGEKWLKLMILSSDHERRLWNWQLCWHPNRNGEDYEIYICGNISIATVKIVAATALMCYILTTSHFTLNPCDLGLSENQLSLNQLYISIRYIIHFEWHIVWLKTLSGLNLPLSSSSTTSRKLLSQFSTCSGWRCLEDGDKLSKIAMYW